MSTPVCVIGDLDSHKGKVTSGSAKTTVAGIGVAYVGSTVSSDSRGHKNKKVVSHGATGRTTTDGKAVAGEGAKVSCDATLTAQYTRTTIG